MSSGSTSPAAASPSETELKRRKFAWFMIRLLGTTGALYAVYLSIDLKTFVTYLGGSDPLWMAAALISINISQIASSERFRYYLSTIDVRLGRGQALALHYSGLFLNIVLPGGISGDGYKVFFLRHQPGASIKRLVQLTLANRMNGLLWLLYLAIVLVPFSTQIVTLLPHTMLSLIGFALLATGIYTFTARRLLAETPKMQITASGYSFIVQALMVTTAVCQFHALGGSNPFLFDYLIIFLLSCIVATLPISIGGIGIRELVLLQGSAWLGIDPYFGVALAVTFFILYLASSCVGMMFSMRVLPGPLAHPQK